MQPLERCTQTADGFRRLNRFYAFRMFMQTARSRVEHCGFVFLISSVLVFPATAGAQLSLAQILKNVAVAFSPAGRVPGAVTLNGTVTWTAGSTHESGTIQLKASVDGSSSETWTLATQSHSLVLGSLGHVRTCNYTDPKGKQNSLKDLNCLRTVPWFAPWLAVQVAPTLASATLTTQPADLTAGLERLTFVPAALPSQITKSSSGRVSLQDATGTNITYSAVGSLPSALEYDQAFDSEPAHSIKVRVVFSEFSIESGVVVPHRLQRYVQRTLQADIHVTSVTVE